MLALQAQHTEQVRNGQPGHILFAEVKSVITLGRRQEVNQEILHLKSTAPSTEIIAGDRGGLETWHGPGQWVVFVITQIENWTGEKNGVRKAVRRYLESAHDVAKEIAGVDSEVDVEKCIGLWTQKGKLASVGIRVRDGILQSGMSLNVYPTPDSFRGINPCGLDQVVPDFLSPNPNEELMSKVRDALYEKLSNQYNRTISPSKKFPPV